jgi:hypothetical protein
MGFWNSIFGKKKKKIIVDDFFGELTIEDGYSESKQHFSPTNTLIELCLELENGLPNNHQKSFFQIIETKYDQLLPQIISKFKNEWAIREDNFTIINFKKELVLTNIDLELCNDNPRLWFMSFDMVSNEDYFIFITLNDFKICELSIDKV